MSVRTLLDNPLVCVCEREIPLAGWWWFFIFKLSGRWPAAPRGGRFVDSFSALCRSLELASAFLILFCSISSFFSHCYCYCVHQDFLMMTMMTSRWCLSVVLPAVLMALVCLSSPGRMTSWPSLLKASALHFHKVFIITNGSLCKCD